MSEVDYTNHPMVKENEQMKKLLTEWWELYCRQTIRKDSELHKLLNRTQEFLGE